MTEQNLSTNAQPESREAQPESREARVEWPVLAGSPGVGDPAVEAVLVRLDALPELPVSSHGEVYASLHDDLAAALNEDVAGDHRP
jgi:hypothetical protein